MKPVVLLPFALAGALMLSACGSQTATNNQTGSPTSYGSVASNTDAGTPTKPLQTLKAAKKAKAPQQQNASSNSSSGSGSSSSSSSSTGGSSTSSSSSSGSSSAASKYMQVNASSKTVTLTINGGNTAVHGGLSFDGTYGGALHVTIPKGWKVKVNFTNKSKFLHHSAAVVSSASATSPVFPGATTPNPTVGSAPGGSASFSFTASKTGKYRIACLVPGHEDGGMWATLDIVASGQPSVTG